MNSRQLAHSISRRFYTTNSYQTSYEAYSNRPKAYPNHVPLNFFERSFLAIGSAVTALYNPYRADMIAALGDTTSGPQLVRMRNAMLSDSMGRRILREKPRVTSSSIQLDQLRKQYNPIKTDRDNWKFGHAYIAFIDGEGVSPDTRDPVRYLSTSYTNSETAELAYVLQRHRECHDFYHALTGLPISVAAELAVKWFELLRVDRGLPVSALSAFFGPLGIGRHERRILFKYYIPWAIRNSQRPGVRDLLCVYWEELFDENLNDLRQKLDVEPPPKVDHHAFIPGADIR